MSYPGGISDWPTPGGMDSCASYQFLLESSDVFALCMNCVAGSLDFFDIMVVSAVFVSSSWTLLQWCGDALFK